MPHARVIAGRWLWTLGIGLWLGGLLAIGAIVAPVTAHFINSHPGLDSVRKGLFLTAIVGGSLRVFNYVCFGSGSLLLAAQALLRPVMSRRVALGSLIVTGLLLASALVLAFGFFPAMDTAQAAGNMSLFDHLHKLYEAVSTDLQFPLLLALALLGAKRDSQAVPVRRDVL